MSVSEITKRREALNLSKAALAREAGIHPSTLSLIEGGKLVPYETQLQKLEDAFARLESKGN